MKSLIAANWKMHKTNSEALMWINSFLQHARGMVEKEVVILPPFTSLYSVAVALQDSHIQVGAQNMHWEQEGPYTGEVSGNFIKDMGCEYVLIGHSERRHHFQETDEIINWKLRTPIGMEL